MIVIRFAVNDGLHKLLIENIVACSEMQILT